MGADPERIGAVLRERNERHLAALEQPIRVRPKVRETLAALEGRVRMAMVTGCHRDQLKLKHDTGELLNFFEVIVTGDESAKSKPDPEPYLMAIDELGVEKSGCLAVEDSQRGLAAALAAGIACVVVPTELTRGQDFAGALSVEEDVSGVMKYVRG
jgi:HAD superfamily hydrolase (TIGR01509 family)